MDMVRRNGFAEQVIQPDQQPDKFLVLAVFAGR
jgi:hypothetical protein